MNTCNSWIVGNSGIRSTGLHRFTAHVDNNDDDVLCFSCQNSPDFRLLLTRNHIGHQITDALVSRINLSIRGRCGTEGNGNFTMVINENRYRIDSNDMGFWMEFSI